MTTNTDFQWILNGVNGNGYNIPKCDRTTIRRQAMKKVSAAWRESGCHRRINVGQYPVFTTADGDNTSASKTTAIMTGELAEKDLLSHRRGPPLQVATRQSAIPMPAPLLGLESLTAETGVDLLQLSTLTSTHVGHAVSVFFHRRPSRLVSLLRQRRASYLSHISHRYGQEPCLDHAVRALMYKVRGVLNPSNQNYTTSALLYHGRAFRTLQAAINDPSSGAKTDVLCATELLGLIEVPSSSAETAWAHHVLGASLMIRLRGPRGFTSDYEKDILMSLVSPIICEATRKNEVCFLQEQCWQDVLESAVDPAEHIIWERSRITISLRKLMAYLPGLFESVCSMVCHDRNSSEQRAQLLLIDVRKFREQMRRYYAHLKSRLQELQLVFKLSVDFGLFYELLGTSLGALAMANRLLTALGDCHGVSLEKDAISYASEVGRLEAAMISTGGWASFYLAQKASVATSVLQTAAIWNPRPGELIEKWQFDSWCKDMQRKTCSCLS